MEHKEIKVNIVETKSVMTRSNAPLGGYAVNPYVGCPHACKYCYASFMKASPRSTTSSSATARASSANPRETISHNN